jgi:hypothetical protein
MAGNLSSRVEPGREISALADMKVSTDLQAGRTEPAFKPKHRRAGYQQRLTIGLAKLFQRKAQHDGWAVRDCDITL